MIRRADRNEHQILTRISFSAKRYWDYPDHYFIIWHDELTITPEYIENHSTFVFETEEDIIGFYSLAEIHTGVNVGEGFLEAGLWLEHMFLLPRYIGRGIGRELFHHCLTICTSMGYDALRILADPNATGFYTKMGCRYKGEFPSTIPGRTTPLLVYPVHKVK
ncbi:GNAT family N-acetyltransferase [Desulfopila inferna]|uniref:GNAT family N-acetyltransferase n=1 Tax=Desulfopila inferna TaxID=468528 RepID=UPI0019648B8E|nr:GNAT family N-acetyltransferase [Desulfopila inferna]MBM9604782.1 GNAT family N-acetyltransferase [Desulfopila inferna]